MTTIATRDVNALFERTELQKKIDAEVLARVKKGFLLLQEKHGEDWINKIDMRSLNLREGHACVLGQVYGDYCHGLEILDLSGYGVTQPDDEDEDPQYEDSEYGFSLIEDQSEDYENSSKHWSELDAAWKAVLNEAFSAFA